MEIAEVRVWGKGQGGFLKMIHESIIRYSWEWSRREKDLLIEEREKILRAQNL